MEILNLPMAAISISGGTQSRVSLNESTVAEYAEVIRLGGELPPVIVFNKDDESIWLADGFHRFHAHLAAGAEKIACDIRVGTHRDAILYSVGANASHGLRRTNEDKRRAVQTLLDDPEWATWSDNAIAKACSVSHHTVAAIRQPILANSKIEPVRTVERNGTTYEQNTSKIGRNTPAGAAPVESDSTRVVESDSIAFGASHRPDAINPPAGNEPDRDPEQDDFGPSDIEVEAALADEAAQLEYIKTLLSSEDDPLAKALADVKQMRLVNSALESQNAGYRATINEQIRMIKALRSKLDKLERTA